MIQKITSSVALLLISSQSFAQRSYEVTGLPNGDEVGKSLKVAIPLLIIGFIVAYIFMWSKKGTSKTSNASVNVGCLGVVIMVVGALFLIPLLS